MKIIQTLCSFNQDLFRTKFGWYSSYYHMVSWALSVHSLSRFYDVTLYTDHEGYDVLIRKLSKSSSRYPSIVRGLTNILSAISL